MEKSIKPDRKYLKKGIWILLTVTGVFVIAALILHLILYLTGEPAKAFQIIWIVTGSAIAAMWIISYPILYYWYKNLEYTIFDDRVSIHKGILTKTVQNIPFRAITDFALVRTLYDRMLGIGSIKIQTAGKSAHSPSPYEGSLNGLLDYETLHSELRTIIKSLHPVAEPVTAAEPARAAPNTILEEILSELQEINRNLKKE